MQKSEITRIATHLTTPEGENTELTG